MENVESEKGKTFLAGYCKLYVIKKSQGHELLHSGYKQEIKVFNLNF